MFRLHRANNKPSKSEERVDFKFSNFQALQVPKGWDKLLVSIIPVETVKTTAKSGKAIVRNGNCQWTETLSESIWISQDDSSKELHECLFKFVVSMGSARSGILGEAMINMVQYSSSRVPSSVSLPLRKCDYGTILQLKIQCLTPRAKLRNEEPSNSHVENKNADSQSVGQKSNGFYNSVARSSGFPASQVLDSTPGPGKPNGMGTNYSVSSSLDSFGSMEGLGRKSFLQKNDWNGDNAVVILENIPPNRNYPVDDLSISSHSSFNDAMQDNVQEFEQSSSVVMASSSLTNVGSKNLLEVAEETIEELWKESKKWEREAQKLMRDLDILKKEFNGRMKKQTDLEMELSAAYAERNNLKKEIEQLKLILEETLEKQTVKGGRTLQSEVVLDIQKELEAEIKFHQESNADLTQQLKRSQESNVDLISVLQELEETIEKQKVEMENLTAQNSKHYDMEESLGKESSDFLPALQESESLQVKLQLHDQAVYEKINELEKEQSLNHQSLVDIEKEYKFKISVNEEHTDRLEAQISESHGESNLKEMDSTLVLELFKQLEMCFHHLKKPWYNFSFDVDDKSQSCLDNLVNLSKKDTITLELLVESVSRFVVELNRLLEARISRCKEVLEHGEVEIEEKENAVAVALKEMKNYNLKILQLKSLKTGLEKEMAYRRSEEEKLEAMLLSKDLEIDSLRLHQKELEAEVSSLQMDKAKLQANKEAILRESHVSSRSISDLHDELTVLKSSLDSRVSEKEILEKKIAELQNGKLELQLYLLELEEKMMQLSGYISGLEAQLRYLTDERESSVLQLNKSKFVVMILQEEITRLAIELEIQNTYLSEECNSLQKFNGELKMQNLELHENCTYLEHQLQESHKCLFDYSKKIEALEENLASVEEDFASAERNVTSELDTLFEESRKHKEKLEVEERLLNQRTDEAENLRREVDHLTEQLSVACDEKQRIISETENEMSGLCSDKAYLLKLMSEFEECKEKKNSVEEKLQKMEVEQREKDVLCTPNTDLINELSQIKRINMEYPQKLHLLEEKEECSKKASTLKENQELMEENKQADSEKGDNEYDFLNGVQHDGGVDQVTILQRFLSDGRNDQAVASRKSIADGEVVMERERSERSKSSLEKELRDLHELYFHMSLKYAQVEAQREDLVMKLKTSAKTDTLIIDDF